MTKNNTQKIEIFKSGTHIAANGKEFTFSEEDVKKIAENYNPKHHEAPLVLGHPKDNSPAFGWVKGLVAKGAEGATKLFADIELAAQFAEALKAGNYKKVSAAFYAPNDPSNPSKGFYGLRHVGALGATPPAIKGLEAFNFNDSATFLEFTKTKEEKMTTKKAEAFASSKEDELKKREEALEVREKQMKAEFAEFQTAKALDEAGRKVADLIKEGKVTPAQSEGLVEFMASLDKESESLEFSEAEKTIRQSPYDFVSGFLNKLPKQVEFAEVSAEDENKIEFTEEVLAQKAALFQKEQMEAGNEITIAEAVQHVSQGS